MKETSIKKCGWVNCKCGSQIDTTGDDPFIVDGKMYFHKSCYKEKNDYALIRNLWKDNISSTVPYSQLNMELTRLIKEKDVSSDYLVFALQYVIRNKCNLRYPRGFKYYVERKEIKDEYDKKTGKKKIIKMTDFTANDTDDSPTFSVKKKSNGFAGILGG